MPPVPGRPKKQIGNRGRFAENALSRSPVKSGEDQSDVMVGKRLVPSSVYSGAPHQMTSSTHAPGAGALDRLHRRRHQSRAVSKMIPERTPDRSTGERGYTISRLSHQDLPVFFRAGGFETHLINNFAALFGLTPCVAVLTR